MPCLRPSDGLWSRRESSGGSITEDGYMVGQDEVGPKPAPRRPERKQRDVTPYVLEADFWPASAAISLGP